MRIGVHGVGATGARAARQLIDSPEVTSVLLSGSGAERLGQLRGVLGARSSVVDDVFDAGIDGVIIAGPCGSHVDTARRALEAGVVAVSTSDSASEVEALLALDDEARERSGVVGVGVGFSPGLSCVLASLGAENFDQVDEIHVARSGTGGPACARQHHDALAGPTVDWRDGGWQARRSGSGRELIWFPEPIGARDCYRAQLPDGLLLVDAFPFVQRVTARLAANRRDRLTAHLPMVRRPHDEAGPGALRVEVRGRKAERTDVEVFGAMDRPALAAGAVAALTVRRAVEDRVSRHGAAGLAALVEPKPFLSELAGLGVKAAVFEGSD